MKLLGKISVTTVGQNLKVVHWRDGRLTHSHIDYLELLMILLLQFGSSSLHQILYVIFSNLALLLCLDSSLRVVLWRSILAQNR